MMSHELRNPLNGVLGPLALLGQSDLPSGSSGWWRRRSNPGAVDAADARRAARLRRDAGRALPALKIEPFRVAALADAVREPLRAEGAGRARVEVAAGTPERVHGDLDRLRQVFVHLRVYMLEGARRRGTPHPLRATTAAAGRRDRLPGADGEIDWKLDLLMGLSEVAPDQVAAEALRPLIARGLIAAAQGMLTLVEAPTGGRGRSG